MTNALKSKIAKAGLGLVAAASMLIGASAFAYTFTTPPNLSVGSTGPAVMALQQDLNGNSATALNVTAGAAGSSGHETSYFGPATKAAVMKYQALHGIIQTGTVGPLTMAALNAGSMSMGTYPAGCTSTAGFSSLTGLACSSGTVSTLPAGCTSTAGFSPISGVSCSTGTTTTTTTTTGPVSAMLATDNPASGNLIQGQATADLMHIAFTGSGTVTQLTLQRSGISDNSVFPNVYLYSGNTRLTSSASVNTFGQIIFNGLNLAVNGTLDVAVRADIGGTNESTVMVTLTSYMTSGATAATTTTIAGNTFFINSGTGILSTVNVGANTWAGTTPSVSAGTTNYSLWSAPVTVSLHSVWLKSANFEFIGSAPSNAFANLGLYANGVKIATSTGINSSGYITFDLTSNPYSMPTGATTLEVRGDIVNGSARTAQLSLQNASDLMLTDSQVGVNISVYGATGTTPFSPNNGGSIQIQQGSLVAQIDPAFSAMTNVTGGATNVAIAGYQLTSYGEDVKVNTIQVTPVVTAEPGATGCGAITAGESALTNVTLYYNGGPVGSSQNAVFAGAASCVITPLVFNPGSNLTIAGGTTGTFQIHADLVNTGGTKLTSGTVSANVVIPIGDYQGLTSNQTNVASYTFPSSNALTVQSGSLTIGTNTGYLGQTISPNTSSAMLGSFTIQNNSTSEAVQVNSLTVGLCGSVTAGACATAYNPITNISTLMLTGIPGTAPTPIGQPTASNNFSVNFTIPAGGSQTVNVIGNLGSSVSGVSSATNVVTTLGVVAVGATSRVPLTPTAVGGQTMILGIGSLNAPTLVTSQSTNAQYISSGGTGATNAAQETYNFVASSGTANVVGLKFAAYTNSQSYVSTGAGSLTTGGAVTITIGAAGTFVNGDNVLVTTTGIYGGTNAVGTVTSGAGTTTLVLNITTPMVLGSTSSTSIVAGVPSHIYRLSTSGATGVALTGTNTGSASFNNGIAYLSSINGGAGAMVPNNPSGVTLPVFVSYGPVNTSGGVASGTTSTILLEYVQYQSGSTTSFLAPEGTTVAGTTITLVGSKPNITLLSSGSALTAGTDVLIGTITVAADNTGDIALSAIPVILTLNNGGGTASFTGAKITDTNDVALANFSNPTCTSGQSCTSTGTWSTHYRISAGSSKTFEVRASMTGTLLASSSLSFGLGSSGSFTWDDINGGGTGLTGAALYSYPSSSVSIHN
jgi:hypothetical protein